MKSAIHSTCLLIALSLLITGCGPSSHTEKLPMRDGIHLATDIYLPSGKGPWPVILFRTPYGKNEFRDSGLNYAELGIAAVGQDMRGRFDSEGVDMVFTTDGDGSLKDGYDTMAWISSQVWCNGKIGTTGGSARGLVQYMQNSANPPGLVVTNPVVATPNLYQDAIFNSGVFRHQMITGWLAGQGSLHFLENIAAHPYEDAFWASAQTADQYASVTVPGLHEGGWYDIFVQGTLDGFMGYQHDGGAGAAGRQKLIMGPWTHGEFHTVTQGELIYPPNAAAPPFTTAFETLFIYYLELDIPGYTDTPDDVPTVQYYVMGDVDDIEGPGNYWRTAEDWPPEAAPVRMHLQPGGLLAESCPSDAGSQTAYTFDPEGPSPTVCGNNLTIAAGPCDQGALIEGRDDVILFTSGALADPMEITGRVKAHIFADISGPDADIMVRLTDVYPDGRSMLIADSAARLAARNTTTGIVPLAAGEVVEIIVDLYSTSIIINKNHRLRISVTSSNWPRFAVNQNNGRDFPESIEMTGSPVTVAIHHSPAYPSYLEIPNPSRTPQDYTRCGE